MAATFYCVEIYVVCLILGSVLGTVIESALYEDTGLDDFLFTENLLFETKARSLVDCGRLCAEDDGCVAFTYITVTSGSEWCQGHSGKVASASAMTSSSGARTFNLAPEEEDYPECAASDLLDATGRSVEDDTQGGSVLDMSLIPGWYRFKLYGENAVMPTKCRPQRYFCASFYPMWLDLQGGNLPGPGKTSEAQACGGGDVSNCCNQPRPVTMRNCGAFFIYYLQATEDQNYNYCTQNV